MTWYTCNHSHVLNNKSSHLQLLFNSCVVLLIEGKQKADTHLLDSKSLVRMDCIPSPTLNGTWTANLPNLQVLSTYSSHQTRLAACLAHRPWASSMWLDPLRKSQIILISWCLCEVLYLLQIYLWFMNKVLLKTLSKYNVTTPCILQLFLFGVTWHKHPHMTQECICKTAIHTDVKWKFTWPRVPGKLGCWLPYLPEAKPLLYTRRHVPLSRARPDGSSSWPGAKQHSNKTGSVYPALGMSSQVWSSLPTRSLEPPMTHKSGHVANKGVPETLVCKPGSGLPRDKSVTRCRVYTSMHTRDNASKHTA